MAARDGSSSSKMRQKTATAPLDPTTESFWLLEVWNWLIAVWMWPSMCIVPWVLSSPHSPISYRELFPSMWYEYDPGSGEWPNPFGVSLGIFAVIVGQAFVWFCFFVFQWCGRPRAIQTKGIRSPGLWGEPHPETGASLVVCLYITWMFRLLPSQYYSFQGTIQWKEVLLCLILNDAIVYVLHRLEHEGPSQFYQLSHKIHHRFTNPRMIDVYNAGLVDQVCIVQIPMMLTAYLVPNCNIWTYMTFGSTYFGWQSLVHSEYAFPWDGIFQRLGLGTPADHHVHHVMLKCNYGNQFLWFDILSGTYRSPLGDPPRFCPNT